MRRLFLILSTLSMLEGPGRLWAAETVPLVGHLRELVAPALPLLEREGRAWIKEQGCVSCHQVPFMLWSLRKAEDIGWATPESKDRGDVEEWALDWNHWMRPGRETPEPEAVAGSVDTMAQLLLALPEQNPVREAPQPWVVKFQDALFGLQEEDGLWDACGQLPLGRRPEAETRQVSSLWVLWALHRSGADRARLEAAFEKAKAGLANGVGPVSTEAWALAVLRESAFGTAETVAAAGQALLERQRPAGGWGWLVDEPPNALGTGMALYALAQKGGSEHTPAVNRAIQFLQRTQKEDGGWAVPSTRKKDQLKVKDTTIFWGTAWSVIGVVEVTQALRAASGQDPAP